MDSAEVILPPCMMPKLANTQPSATETRPAVKSACPWGKVQTVESVCFNDVMSEQLANVLQRKEEVSTVNTQSIDNLNLPHLESSKATVGDPETCDDFVFAQMVQMEFDRERDGMLRQDEKECNAACKDDADTSDDFLLAQMMQLEFDREHDGMLRQEEKKYNGTSKVSVSFDKYLRLANDSLSDDDDDEENELLLDCQAKGHWSNFDGAEKALQAVGKSGVSRQGNITTTKHDINICGIRNASKLLLLAPSVETGDSFDVKLSNNVYNTLKQHSRADRHRGHKVHDKREKATAEKALDEKTRLILFKFVNNGIFEEVNGCISTGKEAGVYHATTGPSNDSAHKEYALKVFKTTLNEFRNRDQYISEDHRFHDKPNKQNPRKVIHMWAEKEMRNLMRIKKANIPCPDVVALKKHVLVMSFIGSDMIPAPKLKEVHASFEDITIMYEQTIDIMNTLYGECQLVHGDLSEYNLLWHDDKVWVIDVSQAVEITHPRSHEFLLRDCRNICCFFEKQGVINVLKPEALFTQISGCNEVVQGKTRTMKKTQKNPWTNQ